MSRIDRMPDLDWSDLAEQEMLVSGVTLIQQSDVAYQIGNVAIAGLFYYSYTSSPWFWFALARGVQFRDLLDFNRLKDHIPVGARTLINSNWAVAERFAKFYGFEDTGDRLTQHGVEYKIFRRT